MVLKEDNDKYYELLFKKIEDDFQDAPFTISCLELNDYDETLDKSFTEEKILIFKDDRPHKDYGHFRGCHESVIAEYTNYTVIKADEDNPITLRQIINTLIKDPHYHREEVIRQDHRFLEHIEFNNYFIISGYWGS